MRVISAQEESNTTLSTQSSDTAWIVEDLGHSYLLLLIYGRLQGDRIPGPGGACWKKQSVHVKVVTSDRFENEHAQFTRDLSTKYTKLRSAKGRERKE